MPDHRQAKRASLSPRFWQNPAVSLDVAKVTATMIQDAIESIFRRFQELCDAYLENPDVLTGLALDEVVGQLKQAAAGQLQDQEMVRLLFELRRLIPRREPAEFRRLLDAVRNRAIEHDLS
jgi:hypothetical protein